MPWVGPVVGAGISAIGSMAGNAMSSAGASSSNAQQIAANMQMQQRAFTFDAQQQAQAEAYNTQMSNTSMQRRVADLRAAGLNPYAAMVSGQGASAPTVSGIAGPGGGVGSLQNPNAAYGQLGNQLASAVSTFQQGELVNAQARKTNADAAQVEAENAGDLGGSTAAAAKQSAENLIKMQDNLDQQYENLLQENHLQKQQTMESFTRQMNMNQEINLRQQMFPLLQRQQELDNLARSYGMNAMHNKSDFSGSGFGQWVETHLGVGGGAPLSAVGSTALRAAEAAF